jgi:hypothetical protein
MNEISNKLDKVLNKHKKNSKYEKFISKCRKLLLSLRKIENMKVKLYIFQIIFMNFSF